MPESATGYARRRIVQPSVMNTQDRLRLEAKRQELVSRANKWDILRWSLPGAIGFSCPGFILPTYIAIPAMICGGEALIFSIRKFWEISGAA